MGKKPGRDAILHAVMRFPAELESRYRFVNEIGRGGMGVVYRATHLRLDRPVAIKFLNPELSGDAALMTRFLEEGKLAARVRHPNVVLVLETGTTTDGSLFIVYEYLEGENLKERLDRAGAMNVSLATRLIVDVLMGLEEIHRAGILHRDIKLANILLLPSGQPKIVDFGIARDLLSEHRRTRTGEIVGTPEYLAPEVILGHKAGPASDLYSVGVVIFQMITGRNPLEGQTLPDLLKAHLEEAPIDPIRFVPGLPPQLGQLILKTLSKRPEDRPCGALALAESIQAVSQSHLALGRGEPRSRKTSAQFRVGQKSSPTVAVSRINTSDNRTRVFVLTRSRLFSGVIGAGLLGLTVAFLWFLSQRSGDKPTDRPAPVRSPIPFVVERTFLTPIPGSLRILLEPKTGSEQPTRTVTVATPLEFPIDVGKRFSLNAGAIPVSASDVAQALLAKMDPLPSTLQRIMTKAWFQQLKSEMSGLSDDQSRARVENLLVRLGVLDLWQTAADHLGSLLREDLHVDRIDRLLDVVARLEDVEMIFRKNRLPVPVNMDKVRGTRWSMFSTASNRPLTLNPYGFVRFNRQADVIGAVDEGFVWDMTSGGRLTSKGAWVSGTLFEPPGRHTMATQSREALLGEAVLPAIPKGRRGALAVTMALNSYSSLRVRINDQITVRLHGDGRPGVHPVVTHVLDSRLLRRGRNDLVFFAVSCVPMAEQTEEQINVTGAILGLLSE